MPRVSTMTILLALAAILAGGCASTMESDLPWNTPASWEGSPFIPGFSE